MGCQPISSDFSGPLPKDTVGLVLGRASTTLRGLIVHPGVIDQDFEGVVKIMCSSPRGISAISPGDCIAQLLILPSLHSMFPSKDKVRGKKGFGSSGGNNAFISFELGTRPTLELKIEGKLFKGLLDTGADITIMSTTWWPKQWPINRSHQTLQGLGYESTPHISAKYLHWEDSEGRSGTVVPYVLPLPINLWGRDILQQMDLRLSNEYSEQSRKMMHDMGYTPGKGLGKHLQGMTGPVPINKKLDRTGLGFS